MKEAMVLREGREWLEERQRGRTGREVEIGRGKEGGRELRGRGGREDEYMAREVRGRGKREASRMRKCKRLQGRGRGVKPLIRVTFFYRVPLCCAVE